jgi:ribosomal protein S18 acetylase RimI-like enzyme
MGKNPEGTAAYTPPPRRSIACLAVKPAARQMG